MSGRTPRRAPWLGLASLVASVRILDGLDVEILGRRERLPDPADRPAGGPSPREGLATLLYRRFHCRQPAARPARRHGDGAGAALVAALSAANAGSGTWEPGWSLAAEPADGPVVSWGGVRFLARPGDWRPEPGAAAVRVRVGPERRALLPGFYLALGDAPEPWSARGPVPAVRCYWHLRSGEAGVALVARLTRTLVRAGVPFRLKVPRHPDLYPRADAGVLYVPRAHWRRALPLVKAAHRALGRRLGPAVPLLALPLGPGLSLAEDPGTEESFGQHRSRLVAQGLWEARGRRFAARRAAVEEALCGAGLDPARPFLSPGSTDAGLLP